MGLTLSVHAASEPEQHQREKTARSGLILRRGLSLCCISTAIWALPSFSRSSAAQPVASQYAGGADLPGSGRFGGDRRDAGGRSRKPGGGYESGRGGGARTSARHVWGSDNRPGRRSGGGGGGRPCVACSSQRAANRCGHTRSSRDGGGAHAAATLHRSAAHRSPEDPPGWERIHEGSFLEAVLATVSVPFYSADRQRILIPRGSRVVGTSQSVTNQDQSRLAVSFHRLLLPDGRWVSLEFHGLNQVGEGALKDQVNRHYSSMFAAVGAVGILSGLTLRGSNPYGGGQESFQAGAGQGLGQAAVRILDRFLNRLLTITIRAGHRLRIWFTSDLLVPRPQRKGD